MHNSYAPRSLKRERTAFCPEDSFVQPATLFKVMLKMKWEMALLKTDVAKPFPS